MSKLRLFILTAILASSGVEFTQATTATQVLPPEIVSTPSMPNVAQNTQQIALAKGCKIRRYRRPH
jgi:hypothetical protein